MHFSLDVWNTLIIPNKEYAAKRNQLIADKLGIKVEDAKRVYDVTKSYLDTQAEHCGIGHDCFTNYKMLTSMVEGFLDIGKDFWELEGRLDGLYKELQALFLENPPELPGSSLLTILELQAQGHTFSIGSNTNFVSGVTLRKFFKRKGLEFTYEVFSDELRASKPDVRFWKYVSFWNLLKPYTHIGDNPVCDKPSDGSEYKIIKGPHELATTLKELVRA